MFFFRQYFRHVQSTVSVRCVFQCFWSMCVCHVWLCLHVSIALFDAYQTSCGQMSVFFVGFRCVYNKTSSRHNKLLMCVCHVWLYLHVRRVSMCLYNKKEYQELETSLRNVFRGVWLYLHSCQCGVSTRFEFVDEAIQSLLRKF